jgi:transposase
MATARNDAMDDARHEVAAYQRVEVITGRQRRRTWTDEEKGRILLDSEEPGANISAVARHNGVSRGLLNIWRREARRSSMPSGPALFAAVRVESERDPKRDDASGRDETVREGEAARGEVSAIEIELCGATLRVGRGADRRTLDLVISALRGTA